jgi:uncharacterized protein YjbI with pentapeptide repeats
LDGANLSEVILQNALYDDSTIWPEAFDLPNSGAYSIGPRADLRDLDLRALNLSGAALNGVDLTGANLRGAILRGAKLNDAVLVAVDLREADLSDANLAGADLDQGRLNGAIYTANTIWPDGFDPEGAGALLIEK